VTLSRSATGRRGKPRGGRRVPSGGRAQADDRCPSLRCDPQTLSYNAAHELGGKEAVIAAQETFGGHVGPRAKRPGLVEHRAGLVPGMRRRLGCHVRRNVVEERDHRIEFAVGGKSRTLVLLTLCFGPTRVGPPVAGRLGGRRHHRRQQDQQAHRHPVAHQRRRESGEGLRDYDKVAPVADVVHDDVCVLREPGGVVFARQIGCNDVMTPRPKLGSDEVPIPRV
jgi:hypothetical protein